MVTVETEERAIYSEAYPRSRYLKAIQLCACSEVKCVCSHECSLMMLITLFILYCVPAAHSLRAIMFCDWFNLIQSVSERKKQKKKGRKHFTLSSSALCSGGRRSLRKSQLVEEAMLSVLYDTLCVCCCLHQLSTDGSLDRNGLSLTGYIKNTAGPAFPLSASTSVHC